MNIYPAIDLRGGKVVRLREGDPNRQTTFSDDPLATAKQWIEQGAQWLHIVNLDGAFADANDNGRIVTQIAKLNVNVQFGGGIRSMTDLKRILDSGVIRAVLGTIAIEKPEAVQRAVDKYGADAICVALDARDGKIATHGWREVTDMTPTQLGREVAQKGVKYALYTDIHRDGSLIGVNIHETIDLAHSTGLQVIASGGVTRMQELHQLARSNVVEGAIIGMALYEGKLTLAEALLAAKG